MVDVSIILPCYNAASYVEQSILAIEAVMDATSHRYELLLVEDCSRDDTRAILERLVAARPEPRTLLVHRENCGKGRTLSDGFAAACGEVAGYIDLDLQNPPAVMPLLIAAIASDGADVATARRLYTFRAAPYFWLRYLASRSYALLPRYVMQTGLRDVETGCKFFRREKALPILHAMTSSGWFWDTEFMVRAHHAGLVIREIPTPFARSTDATTVRFVRDTYRYLLDFVHFMPTERELRTSRWSRRR